MLMLGPKLVSVFDLISVIFLRAAVLGLLCLDWLGLAVSDHRVRRRYLWELIFLVLIFLDLTPGNLSA